MMKKNILLSLVLLFCILNFSVVFGDCTFDPSTSNESISEALDNCLKDSALVNVGDAKIDGGFANYIKNWTNNIALYLGILSVFSIVFGSFMMTTSAGEDEKINKAKGIIKWGIIGFLGVISASAIINLLIKVIYSI